MNHVVLNKKLFGLIKIKFALLKEDNAYIWEVNYDKIEEYIEKIVAEENTKNDECKKAFDESFYIDGKLLIVFSVMIF